VAASALGRAWIGLLDRWLAPETLERGLAYARAGQIVSIDERPGLLTAMVQDRAARPHRAVIEISVFSDASRDAIVAAMTGEAVHEARLLRGQLPPGLDDLLGGLGLSLLPRPAELVARCDCGEPAPCLHAAAAGWLLAERFDTEPLIILTLRGLGPAALLERLRQARLIQSRGVTAAHVEPVIPEARIPARPLAACLEDFWRPGPQLARLEHLPPPQHAPHALLRRLGPSPLTGRFPLVGLLASIYDTVSQYAIRLRDEAERAGEPAATTADQPADAPPAVPPPLQQR
jgi:uncharacterized Zn finger protein